ncbi:vascular-related unknown protein 4 [Cucumis sativus]|uniref:vascular-related unknown protein 4 n=1 Tax=Cucumis sativus TaxID=3659 RepID=UPI0012F51087|nr:vascular-related unknown protein 4 [Cucumis sativus]KGN58042.2 hypothetical protein Csa_010736 [Cucumis sativus]
MANENSTNNNSLNYHGEESPEDSGWTIYFEDFLNTDNPNSHNQSLTSFSASSHFSLDVTDAASSVAHRKLPHDHNDQVSEQPGFGYKDDDHINFFKKRKMIKELFVKDEALEDTASSPVNSPKISGSTYFSKNQKHRDNLIAPEVEERREMDNLIGIGNDYTELKKRGLCLVPLSMVLNYLPQ